MSAVLMKIDLTEADKSDSRHCEYNYIERTYSCRINRNHLMKWYGAWPKAEWHVSVRTTQSELWVYSSRELLLYHTCCFYFLLPLSMEWILRYHYAQARYVHLVST